MDTRFKIGKLVRLLDEEPKLIGRIIRPAGGIKWWLVLCDEEPEADWLPVFLRASHESQMEILN